MTNFVYSLFMTESTKCLMCDRPRDEHHDFIPVPEGCVCNHLEWEGVSSVPGICMDFSPDLLYPDLCDHCEHDKECHSFIP